MAVAPLTTYNLPYHMAGGGSHGHYAQSERAVAVRRPSSMSSRSSVGRRHRSHRSHAGGSAYAPQNEFPNFALSGDVEIIISADGQERRYALHRLILAQNSGFFEASMSEQWSRAKAQEYANGSSSGGGGGALSAIGENSDVDRAGRGSLDKGTGQQRLTWRYELDWGPEGQSDDIPMLVQKPPQPSIFGGEPAPKPPSSRGKPPASSSGLFRSLSVMQSAMSGAPAKEVAPAIDSDTIRDYDNMFRIFYNYAPQLDTTDITEAYIQCKMLLNLADMYDALDVVGPRVDHHLLQFQARLWKQIAKYPPSYLKLGYLARSRSIFAEALAHVVGQWPLGAPQLREMPDGVLDLIEDKAADLAELQTRIEARLLKLSLTNSKGERVSPHSSYLDWSAVAFFRGWIADHTVPVPLPVAGASSGGRRGSRSGTTAPAVGGIVPSTALTTTTTAVVGGAPAAPGQGTTVAAANHVPVSRSGTIVSATNVPQAPARAPARTFRLLGQGGQAYLTHDECKRFARLLPSESKSGSKDIVRRFERPIEDLKHQARDTVRPLLRSGLQLELHSASTTSGGHHRSSRDTQGNGAVALAGLGLPYLTCTRVEESEWPW